MASSKESAEAAQAAKDAGETLSESQEKWLAYSESLSGLDACSQRKAPCGILLPMLSDLSTQGAEFLNSFAADMEGGCARHRGADPGDDRLVKGATMIKGAAAPVPGSGQCHSPRRPLPG